MVLVEEGDCDRHSCSSDEERNRPGKGLTCHLPHFSKGLDNTFSKTTMFANASKTEGVRSFSAAQDASRVGVTNHHSAIHLDEMEGLWMGWPEATFLPLASVPVELGCWPFGMIRVSISRVVTIPEYLA